MKSQMSNIKYDLTKSKSSETKKMISTRIKERSIVSLKKHGVSQKTIDELCNVQHLRTIYCLYYSSCNNALCIVKSLLNKYDNLYYTKTHCVFKIDTNNIEELYKILNTIGRVTIDNYFKFKDDDYEKK